ncbi:hypothetical protein J6590_033150 [Homalodisca vitripennis]|nr:hypothetical protein J6590_033150 [Homalodisca vitripennis]
MRLSQKTIRPDVRSTGFLDVQSSYSLGIREPFKRGCVLMPLLYCGKMRAKPCVTPSIDMEHSVSEAPARFELTISCLLDRRYQLSHGAAYSKKVIFNTTVVTRLSVREGFLALTSPVGGPVTDHQ